MKRQSKDLALLGGTREFDEPLHVGRPFFPDKKRLLRLISDALDRQWVTNHGPLTRRLEELLAERLGGEAVLVSSGTMALQLTVRALGLRGAALVPAWTFVATANALSWEGLSPRFVDVPTDGQNVTPAELPDTPDEQVRSVVAVHLWGSPCDIDELVAYARKRNLRLLFDAAHAFGATHRGAPLGPAGDASIMSFHATKLFSTIEGGAVITNDEALAREVRLLRDFGFTGMDHTSGVGINGKLNELCAAAGIASLDAIDDIVSENARRHVEYQSILSELPGLELVDPGPNGNHQYVVAILHPEVARVGRDTLLKVLHADGVWARRYFYPGCHRLAPYGTLERHTSLPDTEWLADRVLVLPTGPTIALDDIQRIGGILRSALSDPDRVGAVARQTSFTLGPLEE